MARSDAILERLLKLHPKVIDLSLDRVEHLLERLGHPERALPPVVHVAGTNGKGSVIAFMRSALEAAGYGVHTYTSPHLVRFHERIRVARKGHSTPVDEMELVALLEECEQANEGAAITFFEITTAAAFLCFARRPADIVLLETGLGGRLDATNVVDQPALTIITPVSLDHQQFLGETVEEVAFEKAGILKRRVPCIVGPQEDAVRDVIERRAARVRAPLSISSQDWQAYEEHGRLVYQDASGLIDLALPRLPGRFQLCNAGTAVAGLRALSGFTISEKHIETGLVNADWPARMTRLTAGHYVELAPEDAELWLDGGHNPAAAAALAQSLAELEERVPRPLVLVMGMLNSKDPEGYLKPFSGLARKILTITIPGEENALPAVELSETARGLGFDAEPAGSLEAALVAAAIDPHQPPRILICGSLYLAGHVLAADEASATDAA
ncbi:MAG: bifunctional folylpolyglutamate synthase/dihydrofolate synthase [Hyphomicrobiales bacterium]